MYKVKLALTILTILLTIGPLLGVVYVYRDNLTGLVMPPETPGQFSITNSDIANLNFTALEEMNPIEPVGDPPFDVTTGHFVYDLNLTNPLPDPISVDAFSADILTNTGELIGTIAMPTGLYLESGESGIIDIQGNLDPQLIQSTIDQYGSNASVSVENITLTLGGIQLHLDELPGFGNIPLR